jgi:tetratricopeptide (TPR) repeat protein
MNLNAKFLSCGLVVLVSSFSSVAFSGESLSNKRVQVKLNEANVHYSKRLSFHSKQNEVDRAIQILESIEGKAEDTNLNYEILILESRAYYWNGNHASEKDEKLHAYSKGEEKAKRAQALDDTYAEAYYYAGINLASWGETKGIFALLGRKNELMTYLHEAMSRRTLEGKLGSSIDGYGPNRLLGRVYFWLPSFFGGSFQESIQYLKVAYQQAQNFPLNSIYYAEVLSSGSEEEKEIAKQLLDELLAQDPISYYPSRAPENLEEFELARKVRSKLGES